MRILVIGYYWSGKFSDYVAGGLKDIGHDVLFVYENELSFLQRLKIAIHTQAWLYRLTRGLVELVKKRTKTVYEPYRTSFQKRRQSKILPKARRFHPDAVIVVQGSSLQVEVLEGLKRELNLPIAVWFGDNPLHWTDGSYDKKWAYFDIIFVVEPTWPERLRLFTSAPIFVLPLGTVTSLYFSIRGRIPEKYSADVAFVAAASEERAEVLRHLVDYDLKIFGPRWDEYFDKYPKLRKHWHGAITPKEVNLVYNGSKIILGLYARETKNSVSQRFFDTGASGGFLLTEQKPQISQLFRDGIVAEFSSISELKEKIDYYLSHESERKRMARLLQEEAVKNHTYKNRVGVIVREPNQFMKKNG